MYYYFHHPSLKNSKYAKLLIDIETKLHKLGLDGKTTRLGTYSSLEERFQEIEFSLKDTIVIVGDDNLFSKSINLIGHLETKPILGYIPISDQSNITENLGLPIGAEAVMVLANRRIESLDLGQVGDEFFIDSLSIENPLIELNFDNKFAVKIPSTVNKVDILNLKNTSLNSNEAGNPSPKDGVLEVILLKSTKGMWGHKEPEVNSFFKVKNLSISSLNGEVKILIDNSRVKKTPQEVEVLKAGLKVIVGKQRLIG